MSGKDSLLAFGFMGWQYDPLLLRREPITEYRKCGLESITEQLTRLNAGIGTTNSQVTTRDEAIKRAGAILKSNKSGKYFEVKTRDGDANPLGFKLEGHVYLCVLATSSLLLLNTSPKRKW